MNGSTITKRYNHCLLSNLRWHKDINEKKSCSQEKHEEEFHKKVILEKKNKEKLLWNKSKNFRSCLLLIVYQQENKLIYSTNNFYKYSSQMYCQNNVVRT